MAESWWLKFERAEKHMGDINLAAVAYARSHPYKFTRLPQRKTKREIRFAVKIVQPDAVLLVVLGDLLFDLRSALDHAIAAFVPKEQRNHSSFPIFDKNPWGFDPNGHLVVKDESAADGFDRATRGVNPLIETVVEVSQPYHSPTQFRPTPLELLSILHYADKHGQLALATPILSKVRGLVTIRGAKTPADEVARNVCADGAMIVVPLNHPRLKDASPSEVDVEFSGATSIQILVRAGGKGRRFALISSLNEILDVVRTILEGIEGATGIGLSR